MPALLESQPRHRTALVRPARGRLASPPLEAAPAHSCPRLPAPPRPRWYVLHTRSRQEKALARDLRAAGILHYLPLVKQVRFWGHRRRVTQRPLFTSYVFMNGLLESTYFAVGTNRVSRVLAIADQDGFEFEMAQIRMALSCGATLDQFPFLRVGRRARVTAGPFRGIEGWIEDQPRPERLILRVTALGQATSLEIDASLLEPAD